MLSAAWRLIQAEAGVAAAQLGLGATALGRTSPHQPWSYAQAFFPLTIGMERAAKLALQIDARTARGDFLPEREMRALGHNLTSLLDSVEAMAARRGFTGSYATRPRDPIHDAIVMILSQFATGGRYYNLDALAGSSAGPDPAGQWWVDIVTPVIARDVRDVQRSRATSRASFLGTHVAHLTDVYHVHVDGSVVRDIAPLAEQEGLNEVALPWTRMYTLQVVRWLVTVLSEFGRGGGDPDVPVLWEFFPLFMQPDAKLRSRKTWRAP